MGARGAGKVSEGSEKERKRESTTTTATAAAVATGSGADVERSRDAPPNALEPRELALRALRRRRGDGAARAAFPRVVCVYHGTVYDEEIVQHPVLGPRAVQRCVPRDLVQPVAAKHGRKARRARRAFALRRAVAAEAEVCANNDERLRPFLVRRRKRRRAVRVARVDLFGQ